MDSCNNPTPFVFANISDLKPPTHPPKKKKKKKKKEKNGKGEIKNNKKMLWADKHRPTNLSRFDYHQGLCKRLSTLVRRHKNYELSFCQ